MNSALHRSLQVQRRLLIGLLTLAALRAGSAFLGFAATPDAEIIHGRRFEVLDGNGVDYGSLGMLQQMPDEVGLHFMHHKTQDADVGMFERALMLGRPFRGCELAISDTHVGLSHRFDMAHVDVGPTGPDLDMELRVGESQARWQLWNSMPPPNQKLKIKRGDSESALGEDGANPPFTIDPQRGPLPARSQGSPLNMRAALHQHCRIQRRLLLGLLMLVSLRAGSAFLGFAPTPDAEIIHGRRFEVLDGNGIDYGELGMMKQSSDEVALGFSNLRTRDTSVYMQVQGLLLGKPGGHFDLDLFDTHPMCCPQFGAAVVELGSQNSRAEISLRVGDSTLRSEFWTSGNVHDQHLKLKRANFESVLDEDGASPPFAVDPKRGPPPAVPKDVP